MADRIQLRNDNQNVWAIVNPILADGEIGFERDTRRFKIGDGINRWNDLAYQQSGQVGNIYANNIGTKNDLVVKFSPIVTSHTDSGLMFVNHSQQNSGEVTIAIDNLPSVQTYKHADLPLQEGDIQGAGWISMWRYNTELNKYQLLNPRFREDYSANFNIIGNLLGGWSEEKYRWYPPRRVYLKEVSVVVRIPTTLFYERAELQLKKNGVDIGGVLILHPNETESNIVSLHGLDVLPTDYLTVALIRGASSEDAFIKIKYN